MNALLVYYNRSVTIWTRTYGKVCANFRGLNVPEDGVECKFFAIICIESLEQLFSTSIFEKNYKDLLIYFTRYDCGKSIEKLSLYCCELMGKIEEHGAKKYLMIICQIKY